MYTLKEFAVALKTPYWRLEKALKDPDCPLMPKPCAALDNGFGDEIYEKAALLALKNNFNAGYLVVMAELMLADRADILQDIDSRCYSAKRKITASDFEAINYKTVFSHSFKDAVKVIEATRDRDDEAQNTLASWVREIILKAGKPIGYYYIACRIIACFPREEWLQHGREVSSAINRLCTGQRPILKDWVSGTGKDRIFSAPKYDF